MTNAEILSPGCPACGVVSGAECVAPDAAVCEERLEVARAHRVRSACADCRALRGVWCVCESRMVRAQPGYVADVVVAVAQLSMFGEEAVHG